MALRKFAITSVLALIVFVAAPAQASADWLFTPFFGMNWGGNAEFTDFAGDFEDEFEQKMNFGASLSWMGAGAFGFEVDFGYSPNFFQNTTGDDDFEFGDSNVTTLMGNVLFSAPPGSGIRPYGSAGLGLIRANISSATNLFNDIATNDLGVNVGGGITGNFSDNFGIRGDIRYFRSLQDAAPDNDLDLSLGSFDFWRGTVGLTFRW